MQTGWGRTGDHLGLAGRAPAAAPGLVTFAKGIGNGMSVRWRHRPRRDHELPGRQSISTFGGTQVPWPPPSRTSPTSSNDLQGNARRVGGLLIERLRAVGAQLPGVREVRGRGLMIGVELVRPGTDGADPQALAAIWRRPGRAGCSSARAAGTTPAPCRITPPLSLTVAEAEGAAL